MSTINNGGLIRELKKTEGGIRGTMGWIEERVSNDIYEKMKVVIKQSIRYGAMMSMLESNHFRSGIEEESND